MTKLLQISPKAKGLIFDMDGTIANSIPLHLDNWDEICKDLHCSVDRGVLVKMTGRPTVDFARHIIETNNLHDVDAHELARQKQKTFWKNVHRVQEIKEVTKLIYEYHNVLPMSVGTGACRKSALLQLETLNLTKYFRVIVSADDVVRHKPHPDTFLKCAEAMDVDPKYCQVFEDGELGLEAARMAGMIATDVRPYLLNNDDFCH
ncbi:MAG: HAD-IA family hydrolase [Bacteroidales bacterium]